MCVVMVSSDRLNNDRDSTAVSRVNYFCFIAPFDRASIAVLYPWQIGFTLVYIVLRADQDGSFD